MSKRILLIFVSVSISDTKRKTISGCTVAINFEGSDSSAYGLNTPAYVAIDDIDVTVNE